MSETTTIQENPIVPATAVGPVPVHIRWMIRRDIPEVLTIDAASFDPSWSEEEFLQTLRQRNCIGMVAECGERVVGFMIYDIHHGKLHIQKLAVHQLDRHQDIGTQLVAKLISKLNKHQRTRITIELNEWNTGGHLFFKKQGFKAISVTRNAYQDGVAAYVMQYATSDSVDDTLCEDEECLEN